MSEDTECRDGAVIRSGCDASIEPLRQVTHYTGEPGCIADAREFTDRFFVRLRQEWCVTLDARAVGDVLIVVSELVTNADRHSAGPYVLELEGTARHVAVTVYDSSAVAPLRYPKDPGRIGGHGLEIVDALAEVTVERVPVGKRVRAVLTLA
ncbi:ATP-binding protein [Streptomyces sp. VRA16 Mangrove soil]|uniref:ATP-binding protein n=1 Tax=Streptomyces sp. VRA16 Mangrove soil TaxID=2817434 RepID=UPI001A9EFEA2|nr:ATP-binding protein [Streptomyces sp. VRA16 Mangrove soil]MBO1330619.1 ATP-binding protein [Streptomyces sp. VRA16 Mangrove soil]